MIKNNRKIKERKHPGYFTKSRITKYPIAFRANSEVAYFLGLKGTDSIALEKSQIINKALQFYKQYIEDKQKFMTKIAYLHPYDWRYVNRKLSKQIKERIREIEKEINRNV